MQDEETGQDPLGLAIHRTWIALQPQGFSLDLVGEFPVELWDQELAKLVEFYVSISVLVKASHENFDV